MKNEPKSTKKAIVKVETKTKEDEIIFEMIEKNKEALREKDQREKETKDRELEKLNEEIKMIETIDG